VPKYMLVASYNAEGAKGLLKEGGSKRRERAQKAVQSVGGKMESFYFAFGADDAFVIVDFPDHASAAAAALTVGASGFINLKTVVLMTPEEIDQAAEKSKSVDYTPPGK
jgi:uncharacterized protein with GYD domain